MSSNCGGACIAGVRMAENGVSGRYHVLLPSAKGMVTDWNAGGGHEFNEIPRVGVHGIAGF